MRRDEAIGYEAAGGAAVYRGEWKHVRSVPPYGDRKWRLYNLRDDPNEARDMSSAEPELARAMPSDFAARPMPRGTASSRCLPTTTSSAKPAQTPPQQSSHHTLEQERSCGFIPSFMFHY